MNRLKSRHGVPYRCTTQNYIDTRVSEMLRSGGASSLFLPKTPENNIEKQTCQYVRPVPNLSSFEVFSFMGNTFWQP